MPERLNYLLSGSLALVVSLLFQPPSLSAQVPVAGDGPWSLQRCIDVALERSPDIKDADLAIRGAEASRKSTRGQFLPSLDLEGNVMVWDDDLVLSFGSAGGGGGAVALPPPNPADPYQMALAGLLSGFSKPTKLRKQVTWGTTVSISQPLTPILTIYQVYKLKELGVSIARIKKKMRIRDLKLAVTEQFIQILKIQGGLKTLAEARNQLMTLRDQAQALFEAEVIGKNDLLRIEVALAQLDQQRIQLEAALHISKAAFGVTLGLGEESLSDLIRPEAPNAAGDFGPLGVEKNRATASRIELKELDLHIKQAERGKNIAQAQFVPTVGVSGAWDHSEGSTMSNDNTVYVGAFLKWNLWSWGKDLYAIDEAEAGLRRARVGRDKVRDFIFLDVTAAFYQHRATRQAIGAAQKTLEYAQENYELVRRRFEAQTVTGTDLIEAHAQLVRAETELDAARFDFMVAIARLNKATGRTVTHGFTNQAKLQEGSLEDR